MKDVLKVKSSAPTIRIALAGNPNCGKSCIFNTITGLHQKTGNYPGVTIDKRIGWSEFELPKEGKVKAEWIDLPGLYGLAPGSEDETIAYQVLTSREPTVMPDLVIMVLDASRLKRSLYLCTEVIDQEIPVVIALNMVDVAEKKGVIVDTEKLSKKLQVPVIPVNGKKQTGISQLLQSCSDYRIFKKNTFVDSPPESPSDQVSKTIQRYRKISEIIDDCIMLRPHSSQIWTLTMDKILTHKFWGFFIFMAILFLIFQAIFSWSAYPMNLIDTLFIQLRGLIKNNLPDGLLTSLVADGLIPGFGGILMFVPQIISLFFFIAVLEDTGYLARVTFIMDKIMRKFGLNGRSVIPLISGAACAIPAIMSTRIIKSRKEKLLTILVIPLISCSARLPVYILLISLIIPADATFGFINLQGLVLMGLYLTGIVFVLLISIILKYLIRTTETGYFIMELPEYQVPQWKTIGLTILEKVRIFTFEAGKIIMAVSVILWALASGAPGDIFEQIERKYSLEENFPGHTTEQIAAMKQSEKLAASYAGILGRQLEPLIEPLGYDWKIGIAIITSFAAREVFVGTMATIYSVGDENNRSIRDRMMEEINLKTGQPQYGLPVCISLLIFYAFALQCMSTIAVVLRETKHWKWPVIQLVLLTGIAYLLSFTAYQLLK